MKTALILLTGLVLGSSGAFAVSRFGHRLKLTDNPNERSSHTIPTPKGGGIGILASFILFSVYYSVNPYIWLPVAALSLISLAGDLVHISRILRLSSQIIAAVFCIHFSGSPESIIILLLWSVFIAGTANFYNFMDGINGIAGITAICASILVLIRMYSCGESPDVYHTVFLAVGSACMGFLPFNIPSARVFMGDVGSILTGFWFGFLVFINSTEPADFFAMISFMLPFYLDAAGTIVVRIFRKENIAKAHRSHIYQILANEAGIRHWKVSGCYGLLQVFTGIAYICAEKFSGISTAVYVLIICSLIQIIIFSGIRFRFEKRHTPEIGKR